MKITRALITLNVLLAGLIFLSTSYALSSNIPSAVVQEPSGIHKYMCRITAFDDGWHIIPDTRYQNDVYWKTVCHADSAFTSMEAASQVLQDAGWSPLAPSVTYGSGLFYVKFDTCSPQPSYVRIPNETVNKRKKK